MSQRFFKLGLVVLLAGVGLALVQFPVQAEHDLDDYNDARLSKDLYDELDDIYQNGLQPNSRYSLEVCKEMMMDALSDDGDTGSENEIDETDLESEMEEAGTNLEDAVEQGLIRADQISSRRGSSPSWGIVRVGSSIDSPMFSFHNLAVSPDAQGQGRNNMIQAKVGISEVIKRLIFNIRRA